MYSQGTCCGVARLPPRADHQSDEHGHTDVNACSDQQRNGHGERDGNAHPTPTLDADAHRVAIAGLDRDRNRCGELHGYGVTNVYGVTDVHFNRGGHLDSDADTHDDSDGHAHRIRDADRNA